ncbi:uncharacterized protein ANIA_10488 [Aspergillus nidulans FGSC A4]|uniref:Cellobiose dehydrogenase-like cytochrome domain-containing protein n=1 Tax=Emericella nidulans (strain FGSC A4 / ATCC 38163 / CBS 112.46 / NRRL 194 / M139) TaxID=227321 RepID=C8V5Y8_EMENI|nr:hypothetical protein [Aspergillus nidulans FGSC A4]CBF75002.1 TPA: hypothetical protein ANIA_10488 [Aspergillus nidulans FGSC A4]
MGFTNLALTLGLLATTLSSPAHAQNPTGTLYTDKATNITFSTWSIPASQSSESQASPLTFGLTLPSKALETDATDLIGYLHCSSPTGWCGISLGGSMTDALLLVAFVDSNTVKHTLRYTTEYALPAAYTGNATVSPIHSDVSEDSFTTIVHCKDCLHWEQKGSSGRASTSSGQMDLAYALSSEKLVGAAGCADEARFVRHSQQGTWIAFLDEGAVAESYRDWVGLTREGNNGC